MKKNVIIVISLLFFLPFISCDKGTRGKKTLLPNVTGAAGEVIVVLNKSVWEESIGNAYNEILRQEFPMIPQSEPIFDVVMIPPNAFTEIFKSHRNIVITKVGSEFEKAQIVTQRDVWAAPQTILNVVGPTYPAIAKMLYEERDRFVQLLEQAERDRVVNNAIRYETKGLRMLLEKKFEISLYFPKGYQLKVDTTDFVWISYETPDISQGVFVYQYPYTDDQTFTADYLVEKRNSFVNKYVPGPTAKSYMITETIISPVFQPFMYKDRYFGQLRGLWDVYAHPMGGPFVSLTTIDEAQNRVITIEGYVYAPRFNKRNYVRQLEALLLTFALKPESE
jgi:hypothetical protein